MKHTYIFFWLLSLVGILLLYSNNVVAESQKDYPKDYPKDDSGDSLTVRQLQNLALKNSLSVDLTEQQISVGQLQKTTQSRDELPDLSWNSRLQRTYRQPANLQLTNTLYSSDQSHLLSLDYSIFDFGKQSAKIEEAKAQIGLYENEHDEARIDVIWGVAQAVHSVLTADNLIQNLKRQQEVLKERLQQQKLYFKQGLRSETDVVAAEIDFNRNLLALEQTYTEKRTIISQLISLLNLSDDEQKSISVRLDALPSYDLSMDKIKNVGTYVKNLNDKSFVLIDRIYSQERAKIEATLQGKRADYWPNVGLFADIGKAGELDDPRNQGSVGVQLNWQIPWKGKDQAEVQVLYKQLGINETQHKLAIQKAEETTREKKLLLIQLYRQIKLLDQQLELSRRQQTLLRSRYSSGNATIFELSQMENELLKLELDRSQKAGQFIQYSFDIARLFDERNLQKEVFENFY